MTAGVTVLPLLVGALKPQLGSTILVDSDCTKQDVMSVLWLGMGARVGGRGRVYNAVRTDPEEVK